MRYSLPDPLRGSAFAPSSRGGKAYYHGKEEDSLARARSARGSPSQQHFFCYWRRLRRVSPRPSHSEASLFFSVVDSWARSALAILTDCLFKDKLHARICGHVRISEKLLSKDLRRRFFKIPGIPGDFEDARS